MKMIRTEIEINASAEQVWAVLTDITSYATWNPFVTKASGIVATGAKIHVFIQPLNRSFDAVVVDAQRARSFRWQGRVVFPWLLAAEHGFVLEPLGKNRMRLLHTEEFTGMLSPFIPASLLTRMRQAFVAMDVALKERVERKNQVKVVK